MGKNFAQVILRTEQISMKEEAWFFLSFIPIFFLLLNLKSGIIWAICCAVYSSYWEINFPYKLGNHDSLHLSELFLISMTIKKSGGKIMYLNQKCKSLWFWTK